MEAEELLEFQNLSKILGYKIQFKSPRNFFFGDVLHISYSYFIILILILIIAPC